MKRTTLLMITVMILIVTTACQESSITGTVGTATVKGTVVMSGDLRGEDPSGIEVRLPGTGLSAMTNADGYFELTGVREGENDLVFMRGDGIEATRTVSSSADSVVTIELTGRRGRGRPVSKPGHSIQGSIIEVRESSILVDTVQGEDTEVMIDENTFIYKGAVTLLIGDLQEGELVHIRAYEGEEGWIAQSISVSPRHAGNPQFLPRSAVGEIILLGENELTVRTQEGLEVLVHVDERTEYYKKNLYLDFEDLEVGDRVKVFGVKLEDESLLASWIRVKPGNGGDDGEEEGFGNSVHGEVISVAESSLVVRDGDMLEVTVEVDDSTEIKRRGKSVPFTEIIPGNFLTAVGERLDETTLIARKIQITK